MKVVVAYFGPIVGMARGDLEFDAATVERNAHKIYELAGMAPDMFRRDTREFDVNTEALDAVWSEHEDFLQKMTDMKVAAKALEGAAAEGADEAMKAFQQLGGACKACHDDFRLKK